MERPTHRHTTRTLSMAPGRGASHKVPPSRGAKGVPVQHPCRVIVPDPQKSPAETHGSRSNLLGILAPEGGGRVRWCCGLIDSVASGGRSSTSHRWRTESMSAGCGGFTGVRNGIVAEEKEEAAARGYGDV